MEEAAWSAGPSTAATSCATRDHKHKPASWLRGGGDLACDRWRRHLPAPAREWPQAAPWATLPRLGTGSWLHSEPPLALAPGRAAAAAWRAAAQAAGGRRRGASLPGSVAIWLARRSAAGPPAHRLAGKGRGSKTFRRKLNRKLTAHSKAPPPQVCSHASRQGLQCRHHTQRAACSHRRVRQARAARGSFSGGGSDGGGTGLAGARCKIRDGRSHVLCLRSGGMLTRRGEQPLSFRSL